MRNMKIDNKLVFVEQFETTKCYVSVYKTGLYYLGEEILVLTSVHKSDGKLLIRYGNEAQIASIKNCYRNVKPLVL